VPDIIGDESEAKGYLRTNVSRETFEKFELYVGLVTKWQRAINLFGPKELPRFWQRHMLDGYQLDQQLPDHCDKVMDVGSGGGIPGLCVAMLKPTTTIMMVERDHRKCSFLRDCARNLELNNVHVVAEDVFSIEPAEVDVVTARAFAGISDLLSCLARHGAEDAVGVFLKGENWFQELPLALQQTSDLVHTQPSITDSGAVLLTVKRADVLGLE